MDSRGASDLFKCKNLLKDFITWRKNSFKIDETWSDDLTDENSQAYSDMLQKIIDDGSLMAIIGSNDDFTLDSYTVKFVKVIVKSKFVMNFWGKVQNGAGRRRRNAADDVTVRIFSPWYHAYFNIKNRLNYLFFLFSFRSKLRLNTDLKWMTLH